MISTLASCSTRAVELQHLQRRRVGLVQVIEDDHDRMLARRFPEQRGDGVEQPKARLLGVDVRLGLGDLRRQLRQDAGDLHREVARAHRRSVRVGDELRE